MRIDVISELPAAWRLTVRRWNRMNRSHKRRSTARARPLATTSTCSTRLLIGSLPAGELDEAALAAYAQRIDAAMLKSVRESKAVTSWMNPNLPYETALSGFVHALLERRDSNLFLGDLQTNAAVFAWYGALNSITMATIKSLSPGVPDYYQGCETVEFLLVDPDNRSAVDYERRRGMLAAAQALAAQPDRAAALRELIDHAVDGRAKFQATWSALQLRREHDDMLRGAEYVALEVRGERALNVVAFARHSGNEWVVVIGARLFASLGVQVGEAPVGAVWGDTEVVWPGADTADGTRPPPLRLDDAVSGRQHQLGSGSLKLAEVLHDFTVATLFGSGAVEN